MQLDVLAGRSPVRDLASFILPGSKRLITEFGAFGDNLEQNERPPEGSGRMGYKGWGRKTSHERVSAIDSCGRWRSAEGILPRRISSPRWRSIG
jgi:hypothetical protein